MKFFTFVAVLALSLLSFSAQADTGRDKECPNCDAYLGAGPRGRTPTKAKLVCIRFVQRQGDNVVLNLWKGGSVLENGNIEGGVLTHTVAKRAAKTDEFCIGAQRLIDVSFVELCNGEKNSVRREAAIEKGRKSGEIRACLLGSEACKASPYGSGRK